VSWTICLGWPWTSVLQISASQVAGITGVSHWHLAELTFWHTVFEGRNKHTSKFDNYHQLQ
jgi:hypothetical protein